MKKLAAAALCLAVTATLPAQEPVRLYSHPPVPPQEVLDRLDLRSSWAVSVPTDGRRDGLFSVQVHGDLVLAYTRGGTLAALNAADGTTRWRARLGIPYRVHFAPGLTPKTVLVYNGLHLYALDRKTGRLRYDFTPGGAPRSPPSGDADHVYLTLGGARVDTFEFPKPTPSGVVPPAGPEPAPPSAPTASEGGPAPVGEPIGYTPFPGSSFSPETPVTPGGPAYIWSFPATGPVERTPVMSSQILMVADALGVVTGMFKETAEVAYHFQVPEGPAVPMTQFGDTGYLATRDATVYAVDIPTGKLRWRFRSGGSVRQRPVAIDEDLYIASRVGGLTCLNRETGEFRWRNDSVDRFLAANPKIVYALDPCGQLVLLDRARGLTLTAFNVRDFVVPVANGATDRLFLASNDGLIVCLHDRAYPKPIRYRSEVVVPPPPPKKSGGPPAGKKPAQPAPDM